MAQNDPTKWKRSLTVQEEVHEVAQKQNYFMTCYKLHLASAKLLDPKDIEQAMVHMYRKVPNLRLAIRKRPDGLFWFCEMEKEKIDFEVMENANIEEEFMRLSTDSYDSFNGPLWRTRLQHEPTKACDIPDLQVDYPHQYTLLFATHHGMTDGTSQCRKTGFLIKMINAVIAGKPIDDNEQFGFLSDSSETLQLVKEREEEYKNNPTLYKQVKEEFFENFPKQPTVWAYLNKDRETDAPRNLNVMRILEADLNKRLLMKFKSIKTSFHSGFFSLVNAALIDMMKSRGIIQPDYIIRVFNAVNLRRYWKNPKKDMAFGNNYGVLKIFQNIPNDVHSKLPEYMKDFNDKLHTSINNYRIIDGEVFANREADAKRNESESTSTLQDLPEPYLEYLASNMTDITPMVGTEGEHVQLTSFIRSTTIHNINYPILFMMHTYRGKLMIGIDINTRYVTKALGEELIDRTIDLCKSFSSQ